MTHETTIKRIQELVPSIMSLVFGCEIKWQYTHQLNYRSSTQRVKEGIFINFGNGDLRNPLPINVLFYGNSSVKSIPKKEDVKILGKPITLSVVMLAIEVKYRGDLLETVASNAWFHFGSTRGFWNLSEDNFNDQSEETKTFIGGLLNN